MKKTLFFLILLTFYLAPVFSDQVALLIVATGKYDRFANQLIRSARTYFCPNHHVTYFVFADGDIDEADDVIKVYQERLGWPYDTMMRYHVYEKNASLFENQDYLFAIDADMLFVDVVGDEILGERVATQHPGFVGHRGTYETNSLSKACIYDWEGVYYFAGGFYGGTKGEFLKIIRTNRQHIDEDLQKGIIALWHDESHWNRYCIDHPPTVILSPSYCYPESCSLPYTKKLLALDKNHKEYQIPLQKIH